MADDTTLLRTVLFIAVLVTLVPLVLMAVALADDGDVGRRAHVE